MNGKKSLQHSTCLSLVYPEPETERVHVIGPTRHTTTVGSVARTEPALGPGVFALFETVGHRIEMSKSDR